MNEHLTAGWRYRWLTRTASIVLIGHAAWKTIQAKDTRFLLERLGFAPKFDSPVQWWHAASVGEIQTLWPLLQAAINASQKDDQQINSQQQSNYQKNNQKKWLITTNTTTGRDVLEQRLQQANLSHCAQHAFFPIDTPGISKRFIQRVNPSQFYCMETEIWPNTYTALHNKEIPIAIVNARVTQKTLHTVKPEHALSKTLKPAYQNALAHVTVLSRSEEDAAGYRLLGAAPNKVKVLGDLKFSDNRPSVCTSPLTAENASEPFVVAASTHPKEETALCEQWMQQADSGLLVLVPRHVERGPVLHSELSKRHQQALAPLRSLGGEPDKTHRLYIADTVGEMHDWYAGAAAAFVGGSLIQRGGHNVLEPFFHRIPVVTGENTDNFVDAVSWLLEQEAVCIVPDAKQAISELIRLRRTGITTPVSMRNNVLTNYLTYFSATHSD